MTQARETRGDIANGAVQSGAEGRFTARKPDHSILEVVGTERRSGLDRGCNGAAMSDSIAGD
jgi:hypothetical protein